jgi:hypothetical protein
LISLGEPPSDLSSRRRCYGCSSSARFNAPSSPPGAARRSALNVGAAQIARRVTQAATSRQRLPDAPSGAHAAPRKIRRKRAVPESTWRGAMSEGSLDRGEAARLKRTAGSPRRQPDQQFIPSTPVRRREPGPPTLEKPQMSCLACLWYHTDPLAAIACYRKNDGKPFARGVVRGPALLPRSSPATSPTSDTVFRRGRAGRSGRPKVPGAVQRQRARDRDRVYRERQKAARIAAKS